MAFKPLAGQDADVFDPTDLPWGNKWVKYGVNPEQPRVVRFVQVFDKGCMIVTGEYKAFLHNGTEALEQLMEALVVWTNSKEYGVPLLCCLTKKGKPVLGLDDERTVSRWNRTEDRYVQVCKEPLASTSKKDKENPLLAGRGVRTGASVSVEQGHTFPATEEAAEPSGRRRKGG